MPGFEKPPTLKPNIQLFAKKINTDIITDVINETLSGKGNMTSKYILSANETLELCKKLLGDGYKEIGKLGSGVFEKIVGEQIYRFRIDTRSLSGTHMPNIPHVHVEILDLTRKILVNNHIPFWE